MAKQKAHKEDLMRDVAVVVDGRAFVARLDWRPATSSDVLPAVRRFRKQGKRPTHQVMCTGVELQQEQEAKAKSGKSPASIFAAGLYSPPPSAPRGRTLPKDSVSAAAAFAYLTTHHAGQANSALALKAGAFIYLCVIQDGVPIVDVLLQNAEEVTKRLAGFESLALYTDDNVTFPTGEKIGWEDLLVDDAIKRSRLMPIPVDPRIIGSIVALVVITVASAGGYYWWKQTKAQAAAMLAQQQRAAADPGPRYQGALTMERAKLFVPAQSWVDLRSSIGSIELNKPGWIRKGITCDLDGCTSTWERKGGTTEELTLALVESQPAEKIEDATQDNVNSFIAFQIKKASAGDHKFLTAAEWKTQNTTLLQNWSTAGLQPKLGDVAMFPTVPGVPADYRGPLTLASMPISLTVPAVFFEDVLIQSPPELAWTNVKFEVSPGSDPKAFVSVTLTGVVYVALK